MAIESTATESPSPPKRKASKPRDVHDKLKDRQSSELVIALCGPLGCGINDLAPLLILELEQLGYHVEHIRVSELMASKISNEEPLKALRQHLPLEGTTGFERFDSLQTAGNKIRETVSNSVLAKVAIEDIGTRRDELYLHDDDDSVESEIPAKNRTAYIIDQLKHHEEASLLRKVYGSIFYMLGVLGKEQERLNRLEMQDRIDSGQAHRLIDRDRQEDEDFGQKLEKTLQSADYFIRNKADHTDSIRESLKRFLELIHNKIGITPTNQEAGMYAAYSASLESACLSRQVGAAISTKSGHILSTGKNDVPAAGGGLYTQDHGKNDYRCIRKGAKCYNDEYKNRLEKEISDILEASSKCDSKATAKQLASQIAKNTPIASLIEYSRAIHAEMDAVVSLARNPSLSTQGSILYSTTYPCHNCARHIVAAGISKVVYIQPYEKSLAEQLHNDAITSTDEKDKVPFIPFEGVAPSRYQVFFKSNSPRKKDGKALDFALPESKNVDEEYTISYIDREKAIVHSLSEHIQSSGGVTLIEASTSE